MKELNFDDIIKINFKVPFQDVTEYTGYIFSGTEFVSAEDATDDDWQLLPEYRGYFSVIAPDDLSCYYIDPDSVLYECIKAPALYSGWGYRNPYAGDGLDDLGGEPEFCIKVDEKTIYLGR